MEESIFTHPRNELVEFNPRAKCFFVTDPETGKASRFGGLTTLLRKFFPVTIERRRDQAAKYPTDTDFFGTDPATNRPVPINKHTASRLMLQKLPKRLRCKAKDPKRHGSMVDQEMQLRAKYGKHRWRSMCTQKRPDPCTLGVLAHFENMGWDIVKCQFEIFNAELKLATAVDAMCRDRNTGELVLVELKSAKSLADLDCQNYEQSPSRFNEPLKNIPAAPYWSNQLQLLMMQQMIARGHGVSIRQACVLRVGPGPNGVPIVMQYDMSPAIWKKRELIWTALRDQNEAEKLFVRIQRKRKKKAASSGRKKKRQKKTNFGPSVQKLKRLIRRGTTIQ